jgi:hypothetical protein
MGTHPSLYLWVRSITVGVVSAGQSLPSAHLLIHSGSHTMGTGAECSQSPDPRILQTGSVANMREGEQVGWCLDHSGEQTTTLTRQRKCVCFVMKKCAPWSEIRTPTSFAPATMVALSGGRVDAFRWCDEVARIACHVDQSTEGRRKDARHTFFKSSNSIYLETY